MDLKHKINNYLLYLYIFFYHLYYMACNVSVIGVSPGLCGKDCYGDSNGIEYLWNGNCSSASDNEIYGFVAGIACVKCNSTLAVNATVEVCWPAWSALDPINSALEEPTSTLQESPSYQALKELANATAGILANGEHTGEEIKSIVRMTCTWILNNTQDLKQTWLSGNKIAIRAVTSKNIYENAVLYNKQTSRNKEVIQTNSKLFIPAGGNSSWTLNRGNSIINLEHTKIMDNPKEPYHDYPYRNETREVTNSTMELLVNNPTQTEYKKYQYVVYFESSISSVFKKIINTDPVLDENYNYENDIYVEGNEYAYPVMKKVEVTNAITIVNENVGLITGIFLH